MNEDTSRGGPAVPDDFYWSFEERMRGSGESIRRRLTVYGERAKDLLSSLAEEGAEAPRWLDLGCGRGEFCTLLRSWGWRVEGIDSSPAAVEACRALGIDVTLADVFDVLEGGPPAPDAISAIQLIEHLPRARWLELFDGIVRALRPRGALLLETINGQNVAALADHFFADVTHTWPGHPETLRLMAEHVGFEDVEVRFEHPDGRGSAQDIAIWARKPAA